MVLVLVVVLGRVGGGNCSFELHPLLPRSSSCWSLGTFLFVGLDSGPACYG